MYKKLKIIIPIIIFVVLLFKAYELFKRHQQIAAGYCFAENRKLADQEFYNIALNDFFYNQYDCRKYPDLPLCQQENAKNYLYGKIENHSIRYLLEEKLYSRKSTYIPYQSIEELKQKNPDCCRLFNSFEEGKFPDGETYSPWHYSTDLVSFETISDWDKYIKHGLRIMVLKVKLRYQDSAENRTVRLWMPFSNCGEYYYATFSEDSAQFRVLGNNACQGPCFGF